MITPDNLQQIPNTPGVYLFLNEVKDIIYCGKAKNLRKRVGSYFTKNVSIKTKVLVTKLRYIDWIVVRSEVEALLLENKLIKQHTPRYNITLKDAKTYAYIGLTKEPFPRIISVRKPTSKLEVFGPYTDGSKRAQIQKLVVEIFKLRTCKKLPKRACLNFHIGICTAPCILNVSKEQYALQVEAAKRFLSGSTSETVEKLTSLMHSFSTEHKYEKALEIKKQLQSIDMLHTNQVVDLEKYYDQDVFAVQAGTTLKIVYFGVKKGTLLGKKEYEINGTFEEFVKAFYLQAPLVRKIILSEPIWEIPEEKAVLEEYFTRLRGAKVELIVPVRGDNLSLIELAKENLLVSDGPLVDMKTHLGLNKLPRIIDFFDISNLSDSFIVAGMVRFTDMKPSDYRRFRIRSVDSANDFASMQEAVYRRYAKSSLPDLVIVDGGKGQLSAAKKALRKLSLSVPIIALAKKFEEIYSDNPMRFDNNGAMMLFIRRMRDETHRFAISYNRKRRSMAIRESFKVI